MFKKPPARLCGNVTAADIQNSCVCMNELVKFVLLSCPSYYRTSTKATETLWQRPAASGRILQERSLRSAAS